MIHFRSLTHAVVGVLIVTEQALTLNKGAIYSTTATAVDNYDVAVSVTRTQDVQNNGAWISGSVNTGKRGKYRDTFSASDSSGNVRRIVRTITVQ